MKTLTIAFPAKFQIHARFAMTLMDVIQTLQSCQSEWIVKTKYILGKSNLSHARSVLLTEWYETAQEEDGFFFIDTDHTFTEEDILRVIRQKGDLNAGIYCNRAKEPTCFPLAGRFDDAVENIPLKYAATGFLFFTKKAVIQIHEWMKKYEDLDRVIISDYSDHIESRTIPFFHAVLEPPRASDGKRFWLGEDFSFSYRALQAGLTIRGCISHTLGHEIPYVVFNDKPRRGPVKWLYPVVVVYCGNQSLDPNLLNQCRELAAKGRNCILYSKETSAPTEQGIILKRYEEFFPQDQFSTLIVWGTEALHCLTAIQPTVNLHIMIEKEIHSVPTILQNAKTLIFPNEKLRTFYTSLVPYERTFIGSLHTLL
jgi:hypothetical protein